MAQAAAVDYERLWSEHWGGMQDLGPVHRHVRRVIVDQVRRLPVRSVLDVGCGNGANLEGLQQSLGLTDVTGIDVSPHALGQARRRVRGTFHVMDIQRGALARQFDLVLSSQVVEHIADDEAFLAKLREMCGAFCLVGTMQGRMRRSEATVGHLRNYRRQELAEKMTRAGFAVERVIEWGFPFYSPLYRSAIEYVGGQAVSVGNGRRERLAAAALYHLYRLNSSRRGDVLMMLARAC